MTDRRRPVHIPVLIGTSAVIYAASLAGVTGLQSAADQATIAARAPAVASVDGLTARNDGLAGSLDDLRNGLQRVRAEYDGVAGSVDSVEARLEELAIRVADISGQVAALPQRISLPAVAAAPGRRVAPPVHATTRASGG